MKQPDSRRKSVNWNGPVRAVLLLALLMPFFGAAPPAARTHAAPQAHPALLEIAAQRPDSAVGVIVQKAARNNSPESLVVRLGGVVTQHLNIINAFAATLPASAVTELATSADVRWVSLDAPTVETVAPCPAPCIDVANLTGLYPRTTGANRLWNTAPYLQGQGIGVAVVDSGISLTSADLRVGNGSNNSRVVAQVRFTSAGGGGNMADQNGHGTHVAGIIGGNGAASGGTHLGIAPKVNLINVKVSDRDGRGLASDVVAGLQWILENKQRYNIRVVNISLNSSVAESYHTSPLNAACEILWFNGIVVVVSAGNSGATSLFPPANDPFVITVGAADERGTDSVSDDVTTAFSAYGQTAEGFSKPDLVAPGRGIVSLLASGGATLAQSHPEGLVSGFPGSEAYFRMSGTSVAAPMVAGAAALLLQDEPNLTPDQVKYRLTATARPITSPGAGAGQLDIYAAVNGLSTQSANTDIPASLLLWTGLPPLTWNSVNWNSVNWNSVNWNSVNWNSVNWNSVTWSTDHWDN